MERVTRVKVRKRQTESGGKEGSGGGDGKSDGSRNTGKGKIGDDEADKGKLGDGEVGFAFKRNVEKIENKAGTSKDQNPRLQSGTSKLSYRDKLLSPRCAGFLVKHS